MGTSWPTGITYHQSVGAATGEPYGPPFARNWDTDREWRLGDDGWTECPGLPVLASYMRLEAMDILEDPTSLPPLPCPPGMTIVYVKDVRSPEMWWAYESTTPSSLSNREWRLDTGAGKWVELVPNTMRVWDRLM